MKGQHEMCGTSVVFTMLSVGINSNGLDLMPQFSDRMTIR